CARADREFSQSRAKDRLHMPGSLTTPGRPALAMTRSDVLPSILCTVSAPLSRLDGSPSSAPVNPSPRPSRATAHDLGPMWIATPSSQGTFTLYSLPVSRRFVYGSRVCPHRRHRC